MPEAEAGAASRGHVDRYDRVFNQVGTRVKLCVRRWRRLDARILQPLSPERAVLWQLLAPADYPWFVPALAAILVVGVTVGPNWFFWTPGTLGLLCLGLVLLLLLHALVRRVPGLRRFLLAGYLGVLLLLGGLLVAIAVLAPIETFDPAERPLRVHVGPAVALALAMMLGLASLVAASIVRRVPDETMASALPAVELFQPKDRYDYKGDAPRLALFSILLLVPLRYPVQLLLPASLAALVLPSRWLVLVCLVLVALAWAVLLLGVLFDRLMEILRTLGRLFFIGPQRILSVIVIAIAVTRLAGVHYITYLFDAPAGNPTIAFYVFFAYAVAWFYGFCCDILLARNFICLLDPSKRRVSSVAYAFAGDKTASRVQNDGRTIALHGAGRLMVKGTYETDYDPQYAHRGGPSADERQALTFLTPADTLAKFRTQLEDRGWAGGPDPLPRIRDLQRAVYVFPGITGLFALAFIGLPVVLGHTRTAQPAELEVVLDDHGESTDNHVNLRLQPLLLGDGRAATEAGTRDPCPELGAGDPRVVLAASGGGTRAAIYTASVLRGLAAEGRICHVVHVSGVSGGSAALAYFALNQDVLRTPVFDREPWDAFEAAMAKPFIQELLKAASDSAAVFGTWRWRKGVCGEAAATDERRGGPVPTRVRFGNLLAEDFVCTMGPGTMDGVRFGLILNTGVIGRFMPGEASPVSIPERARRAGGEPVRAADVAGGRLVLTNVPHPHEPDGAPKRQGTHDLRFFTINDPEMSVARAAALSANFPPVFSDAAIDERAVRPGKHDKRFWVTDGGTVENRGVVTLYLSIEDALNGRDLQKKGLAGEPEPVSLIRDDTWPDLHVVIADVSAVGGPYKESYGLRSVQSAGGQMGLALEAELLEDLRRLYEDRGATVTVHELPMPAVLRDGIGTHWMLPNTLDFANPGNPDDHRALSQPEVLELVRGLYAAPGPPQAGVAEDVTAVRDWTCHVPPEQADETSTGGRTRRAPRHVEAWEALTGALGATGRTPCSTNP